VATQSKSIIWIASYPKSGNTWVRFLVCSLIFGPQDSASALNRLAPDLHELAELPTQLPPRLLMKTHFAFSERMPLAAATAGAIYVVRQPADVMLSNFHYARRSGATEADDEAALERYVEEFIAARGDPRWLQRGMGSWEENVRSWIGAPLPFPVLPLRYEDLLADPIEGASRLRGFLGVQCSDEQLARAVAASSFERLRAIEESDIAAGRVGIFYKPYLHSSIEAGRRFMRAGRSGEARRTLSAAQLRQINLRFDSVMQACGYPLADPVEQGAKR
jgi:hypothetical protein